MPSPPRALRTLAERFDPQVFDLGRPRARLRLAIDGAPAWDAVLAGGAVRLEPADESARPDAVLSGDEAAWRDVASDLRSGMGAFRAGRLRVRHDLHLGVGFLAATAATADSRGLRFRQVRTKLGPISTMQAGTGRPVVL